MAHNGGTADCAETEGAAQLPCGSEVDRRARVAVAEPECDQDEPAQRRRAIELRSLRKWMRARPRPVDERALRIQLSWAAC